MWEIVVKHEGLNKYRVIRGYDERVVELKADLQKAQWDLMWLKLLDKQRKVQYKQSKIDEAHQRTNEAQEAIETIETILNQTLDKNDTVDWDVLKDNSQFNKEKPQKPELIILPELLKESDLKYRPEIGFFDRFSSARRQIKQNIAKALFQKDCQEWEKKRNEVMEKNSLLEKQYRSELSQWERDNSEFLIQQKEKNESLDRRKEQYLSKLPDAIVDYCDLVLSNSEYPDYFPQEFELDYNSDTKILVVNYSLPSPDDLPKLKEVKYVSSKNELVEAFLPESVRNKLYDSLIYQIALRTIHELYESDVVNVIDSIVFNGWVESINKATGQKVNACILSVQASREEFLSINLADVDPKVCFRNLKGIGSSKLHGLAPIAPILNISREDKRFISPYEVADDLDQTTNLAAMDWEDFEHLIRELFEKEFSKSGGEVKITQASRDQGVDAVAFDPDPIRGGKIIIQAKRYTNVVGVSAVRDLYGTVINEGATKGILITTAYYGPDAYEFAKAKPLTLLNGNNLLHLLEKHGHKATIDLKAAKQILSEKEKQQ